MFVAIQESCIIAAEATAARVVVAGGQDISKFSEEETVYEQQPAVK